ncbi:MAG: hypothetical protein QUU85_03890 [Candidatus Eisenbacteria bacterium]|nr:hypothetical protein [Candidatus Eisenbacteria bacterium]
MNARALRYHLAAGLRAALASASLACLLGAAPAGGAPWGFRLTPYVWATDVSVEARLDGRQVVDEDIPVSELVDVLGTIFQTRAEVQYGRFGAAADLFDVTLSDERTGVALPEGAGTTDLKTDFGMTIFDFAATYDLPQPVEGLGLLAGIRLLDERTTVDATIHPGSEVASTRSYEADDTIIDALVGLRFRGRLTGHWGVEAQADISTGGTDYTWSLAPAVSYSFGKTGHYGISAGYRILKADFEEDHGFDADMTLSGFLLGIRASI